MPRSSLAATLVTLTLLSAPGLGQRKVKVFILAGQSNMEGKAQNKLLEHQAKDEKTAKLFAHLRKDGKWIVRDDAFIKFLGRKGKLTIGYGSRDRTGAELEFGWVMADHFEDPVLLIKTTWGGHSLIKLFRSPSAGMPAEAALKKELEDRRKKVENQNKKRQAKNPNAKLEAMPTMDDITSDYGKSYRNMLDEVKSVFSGYETMFPELAGKKLELTGFVWFQGWNDHGAEKEYASNMEHFIRDVRKDLNAPKLPFVIGVMGQNGSKPAKGAMKTIQDAQLAMERIPDFRGNVRAVRTDVLVDKAAEELYPTWRKNVEEWEKTGSDFGYHYMGSAIWFMRIGRAWGDAMIEMLGGD